MVPSFWLSAHSWTAQLQPHQPSGALLAGRYLPLSSRSCEMEVKQSSQQPWWED